MQLMVAGLITLAATVALLAALLPRHGHTHRFVGTELEPYVAVGLTALVALSLTMLVSGILNYAG
jgi:hypothetical protein